MAIASRTYRVLLERDDEDGGWVVTVPALPGCITQGDTREEALRNAAEAIACHLEGLQKDGRPLPEDGSGEMFVERVEVALSTEGR